MITLNPAVRCLFKGSAKVFEQWVFGSMHLLYKQKLATNLARHPMSERDQLTLVYYATIG